MSFTTSTSFLLYFYSPLAYISGQVNAWTFLPSSYAIEVYDENDIVNAVKFARDFNIRLVVKGTGMF